MHHQPAHHGDSVEAQLLSHGRGVVHLQDLASDEEHDAKGEVPGVGGAAGSVPGTQRSWEALALHHCLASPFYASRGPCEDRMRRCAQVPGTW